jgi:hypothetical protein
MSGRLFDYAGGMREDFEITASHYRDQRQAASVGGAHGERRRG